MCNVWETIKVSGYSINQILVSLTAALVVFVTYTTMLTVFSFLDPLRVFIIWLQWYARSDWLFSCNDQALLARCPRHIQSVFNFMIVDILMDIHVMVNWQLSKRYPLTSVTWLYLLKSYPYGHPCYGQLTAVKVSADQCHLTVSLNNLYADQLLVLIDRRLRSIIKINNLLTSSVRSS